MKIVFIGQLKKKKSIIINDSLQTIKNPDGFGSIVKTFSKKFQLQTVRIKII